MQNTAVVPAAASIVCPLPLVHQHVPHVPPALSACLPGMLRHAMIRPVKNSFVMTTQAVNNTHWSMVRETAAQRYAKAAGVWDSKAVGREEHRGWSAGLDELPEIGNRLRSMAQVGWVGSPNHLRLLRSGSKPHAAHPGCVFTASFCPAQRVPTPVERLQKYVSQRSTREPESCAR